MFVISFLILQLVKSIRIFEFLIISTLKIYMLVTFYKRVGLILVDHHVNEYGNKIKNDLDKETLCTMDTVFKNSNEEEEAPDFDGKLFIAMELTSLLKFNGKRTIFMERDSEYGYRNCGSIVVCDACYNSCGDSIRLKYCVVFRAGP